MYSIHEQYIQNTKSRTSLFIKIPNIKLTFDILRDMLFLFTCYRILFQEAIFRDAGLILNILSWK